MQICQKTCFCYCISKTKKNEFGQNPEENIILIGPGQYTKILIYVLTLVLRRNFGLYVLTLVLSRNFGLCFNESNTSFTVPVKFNFLKICKIF